MKITWLFLMALVIGVVAGIATAARATPIRQVLDDQWNCKPGMPCDHSGSAERGGGGGAMASGGDGGYCPGTSAKPRCAMCDANAPNGCANVCYGDYTCAKDKYGQCFDRANMSLCRTY